MKQDFVGFEVGKFYRLGAYKCFTPVTIPALCTDVKKRVARFKHLHKRDDGTIVKVESRMNIRTITKYDMETKQEYPAYQKTVHSDKWSRLADTYSNEPCEKPAIWDDVKDDK